jgi:hypothetical protein
MTSSFYGRLPIPGLEYQDRPITVHVEGCESEEIYNKINELVGYVYHTAKSQGVFKDTNGNDAIEWTCRDEDDESYRVSITFICVGSTEYLPDEF